MWLSDSGQTDDDSRADEQRHQNPGERRAPDGAAEERQAGRRQDEGGDPPDVQGPQQQDDGGQCEDGVGDAVFVMDGTQESDPHGRRTRESDG